MTAVVRAPVRIAHLGLGAFHRAHQAWYTELVNRSGAEQWGIAAFTGRRPDAAMALAAQGCAYDLVVRGPESDSVEHISSIVAAHDGADAEAWRAAMTTVAVLTVTITEAGYRAGSTAIERRSSAPGPVATSSGIIPATNAMAVIRMGRSRSRFPKKIASSRGTPAARS